MSNLEQHIRAEQQRLYEIPGLTDEMHDDEAKVLLDWASAQVLQLAGEQSQLEARAKKLRHLVATINYLIGHIEGKPSEQIRQELAQVYQAAAHLNYPIQHDLSHALVKQLAGQNAADALVIVMAWLENDSLLVDELRAEDDG